MASCPGDFSRLGSRKVPDARTGTFRGAAANMYAEMKTFLAAALLAAILVPGPAGAHGPGSRAPAQRLRLRQEAEAIRPYVADTTAYLHKAWRAGKRILLEGQLGALRDPDHGIYPYPTSSSTLAGYGAVGAGLPSPLSGAEQASPEAFVLSATLRALMLESRTDVTAALRE